MRPRCGLMPTRWVQAAGIRTLPAPSEPIAAVTSPAATAAALPPDEPPGVCSRDHGLRVCPKRGPAGERPLTELAGVGLADDDRARGAQPAHDLGVGGGRCGPRPDGAEPGRHARDVDVVLDRDRDSQQREVLARSAFAVGLGGVGERLLGQHDAEGVERGLAGLDRIQRPRDQFDGGDAAAGQPVQQLGQGGRAGCGRVLAPEDGVSAIDFENIAALPHAVAVSRHGGRLCGCGCTGIERSCCASTSSARPTGS